MSLSRGASLVACFVAFLAALFACSPESARDAAPYVAANVASSSRPLFDARTKTFVSAKSGASFSFQRSRVGRRAVDLPGRDVDEWFEERANGIEHGLTITRRPAGDGPFYADMEVDGQNVVKPTEAGSAIDIVRAGEVSPAFRYGGLLVVDARDRLLPSTLIAKDAHTIRIVVDDAKATYPITVDPLVWTPLQKLTAVPQHAVERFGISVCVKGDRIVVGMNGYEVARGAFFVFRRGQTDWEEEAFIPAPYFDVADVGVNVALDGERAMVGTKTSALMYRRTGLSWALEQALPAVPLLGNTTDYGAPIALEGSTAVLSVPDWVTPADDGASSWPGTVFVYELTSAGWVTTATIRSPEPLRPLPRGRIALRGQTLAYSTGPHVFVFHRVGSSWALEATLDGEGSARFGDGLAIGDDILVVGDPSAHAAYIFERNASGWSRTAKLVSPFVTEEDNFGDAVALHGEVGFIGAHLNLAGAVYRFGKVAGNWSLVEEFRAPDKVGRFFGTSLSTDGRSSVFGAFYQGAGRGAAYVYELRSDLGDACTDDEACASGFCVDGVCCENACGREARTCLRCNGTSPGRCETSPGGAVCRASAGECDVRETCDGVTATCPQDSVLAKGTPCTGGTCSAGACRPSGDVASSTPTVDVAYEARGHGCSMGSSSSRFGWSWLAVVFASACLVARRRSRGRAAWSALLLIVVVVASACRATREGEGENVARTSSTLVWGERQVLFPPSSLEIGDYGAAVAQWADTLAVGRPGPYSSAATVHLYSRQAGEWVEQSTLVSSQSGRSGFGIALALRDDTLVVGEPGAGNGAVHVFKRAGSSWSEEAKLVQSDATGGDSFGRAVDVDFDKNVIVVGAPGHGLDENGIEIGAAYVFGKIDGAWQQISKHDGAPYTRYFGTSVAIDGDRIAVGAALTVGNLNAPNVFPETVTFLSRASGQWQIEHVAFSTSFDRTFFGSVTRLRGDTAFVSAVFGPFISLPIPGGAVHVFRRQGDGSWIPVQKLIAPDTAAADQFGLSISVGNDRLAIGATAANGRGAVYLYERDGDGWRFVEKIVARDSGPEDFFGSAVALDGSSLIVSAIGHSLLRGAVYSFFRGPQGDACSDGSLCATGLCIDGVCCNAACGNGDPSDCLACSVKAGAAVDGICSIARGNVCRAARGECDVAETCDGVTTSCPPDAVASNGLICGDGKASCSGGECVPDFRPPDENTQPSVTPASPGDLGCHVSTNSAGTGSFIVLAAALAASLGRRRRR